MQWRNTGCTRYTEVIGTECTGDMHDTRTVFRAHIVSGNHTECAFAGIHPRKKLFVMHYDEVCTLE